MPILHFRRKRFFANNKLMHYKENKTNLPVLFADALAMVNEVFRDVGCEVAKTESHEGAMYVL